MGPPVFEPEPGNFMKTAPPSTRPVMLHIVCGNPAVSIDTGVWLVNGGGPLGKGIRGDMWGQRRTRAIESEVKCLGSQIIDMAELSPLPPWFG